MRIQESDADRKPPRRPSPEAADGHVSVYEVAYLARLVQSGVRPDAHVWISSAAAALATFALESPNEARYGFVADIHRCTTLADCIPPAEPVERMSIAEQLLVSGRVTTADLLRLAETVEQMTVGELAIWDERLVCEMLATHRRAA